MGNLPASKRWAPILLVLLSVAWMVGSLAETVRLLRVGLTEWADQPDSETSLIDLHQQSSAAATQLVFVAAGGAALIAVVAFVLRMPVAGLIFVGLAVLAAIVTVPMVPRNHPVPSGPATPTPSICQERSGGGNDCPGD